MMAIIMIVLLHNIIGKNRFIADFKWLRRQLTRNFIVAIEWSTYVSIIVN